MYLRNTSTQTTYKTIAWNDAIYPLTQTAREPTQLTRRTTAGTLLVFSNRVLLESSPAEEPLQRKGGRGRFSACKRTQYMDTYKYSNTSTRTVELYTNRLHEYIPLWSRSPDHSSH